MRRRLETRLVILVLLLLLAMAGAGYLAGSWNCEPIVATGSAKSGEQAAPALPPRAAALAMARDEAATEPRGRIERKYDRLMATRRKERYELACDASARRAASEACRNVEHLIGVLHGSRARELAALDAKSKKAVAAKKAASRLPKLAMRAPRKKPEAPRKRKSAKRKKPSVSIDASRRAAEKPAAKKDTEPTGTGKTRIAPVPVDPSVIPNEQVAIVDAAQAIPDGAGANRYDGTWVGEWSMLFQYTGGGTYCDTSAKSVVTVKNGKISGWLNTGEADQKVTGVVKEDGSFYLSATHPILEYTAEGKFDGNDAVGEFDRAFCGGEVVYHRKPDQQGR